MLCSAKREPPVHHESGWIKTSFYFTSANLSSLAGSIDSVRRRCIDDHEWLFSGPAAIRSNQRKTLRGVIPRDFADRVCDFRCVLFAHGLMD